MPNEKFDDLYRFLNAEQKLAVDTIDGPVMVIAGPGTGKTTILTLRIANILRRTDTPPECILALTFTESGAHGMRQKLSEIIGSTAYKVNICTFHGYANQLIQNHPESFEKIIGGKPANEIDQIKILESIFKDGKFKFIRPRGDLYYYVRPSLNAIQHLKKERMNANEFKKFTDRELKRVEKDSSEYKKLMRNRELAQVYSQYEKKMRQLKLYDYEDMILEAVKSLMTDKNLLSESRENAHYILADEHQDTNGAQNKLLELIAGFDDWPNLFIVGDEKQAIYRFQGASLENFLYFSKKFKKAKIITLKNSFRSTQTILDASHSLITKGSTGDVERPRLISNQKSGGLPIEIHSYEKTRDEAIGIAKILSELQGDKVAVLYRDNSDADLIAETLKNEGVNFKILSDQNILEENNIGNMLFVLKAVNNLANDEWLGRALFAEYLKLPIGDVFRLIQFAGKNRLPVFNVLSDINLMKKADIKNCSLFIEICNMLKRWAVKAKNERLVDFLDIFIKESGITETFLKKQNPYRELDLLNAFLDIARAYAENDSVARLNDFLNYLKTATTHNIKMGRENISASLSEEIALLTAHRSKGLEFDVVIIARTYDNHWNVRNNRQLFFLPGAAVSSTKNDDDERRLFYVAMTRARKKVIITYSKLYNDGKSIIPARLIEDIDEKYIERLNFDGQKNVENFYHKGKINTKSESRKKELLKTTRALFLEEGLTVTALNNYLECPWKYFFQNLLRLPGEQSLAQIYGTAIHEALKRFQNNIKKGDAVGLTDMVRYYKVAIEKQPISTRDLKDLRKRGEESLRSFFKSRSEIYKDAVPEYKISGIPFKGSGSVIKLRGVIDLLIPINSSEFKVIDYKTSKAKSRNEIMGKTASSDGNYFRQLVFYKLLIESIENKKYKVGEGSIVFVEPDEKGISREENFVLGDSDVSLLRETLTDAISQIFNLSFWNETCEKPKCEFCRLSSAIK